MGKHTMHGHHCCLQDSPICVMADLICCGSACMCLQGTTYLITPPQCTWSTAIKEGGYVLFLNTAAHTARQQALLSKGAVAGVLMMQGSQTHLNFLSTTVSSMPKASTSCRKCNSSGVAEQQYHNCLDLAAERQAYLGDQESVPLIQRHVV
jgi:hypothetical protein